MDLTMGRIVFFTPSDTNDVNAVEAPAIVSRVKDGAACLTVFPPEAPPYSVTGVQESESGASEPGRCCWPQAAPAGSAPETGDAAEAPAETETPDGGSAEGEGASEGDQSPGEAPPAPASDDDGSRGAEVPEGAPTTSEASEKPLYEVANSTANDFVPPTGFSPSGLETPEGVPLFHYDSDTAGQPHTFDLESAADVTLYAEADDNGQAVQPAGTRSGATGTGSTE